MDFRSSITRLAAEVRQTLLATTMDIEQRWRWLSPEDRAEALTDLIALTVSFIRDYADVVAPDDTVAKTSGKIFEDADGRYAETGYFADDYLQVAAIHMADQASLTTDLNPDDVAGVLDAFARVVGYYPTIVDAASIIDAFDRVLDLFRGYADSVAPYDVPEKTPEKIIDDSGELYVEVGYFVDDYMQASAFSMADEFIGLVDKIISDSAALADDFARIVGYWPELVDSTAMADAYEAFLSIVKQDTGDVAPDDALARTLDKPLEDMGGQYVETGYFADDYWMVGGPSMVDEFSGLVDKFLQETTTAADLHARTSGWVRAFDDISSPGDAFVYESGFTRALTESAVSAADSSTRAYEFNFYDIGFVYADPDYFADNYVEQGVGPVVHDDFSYTLA